jgi:hypothetical protein
VDAVLLLTVVLYSVFEVDECGLADGGIVVETIADDKQLHGKAEVAAHAVELEGGGVDGGGRQGAGEHVGDLSAVHLIIFPNKSNYN